MARLEDITVGCSVTGIIGSNTVEIVAVKWFGSVPQTQRRCTHL